MHLSVNREWALEDWYLAGEEGTLDMDQSLLRDGAWQDLMDVLAQELRGGR